uniref:Uncharacterized protein n=1 Tax=Siphoviridae sp. ctG7D9 TaxID=2826218 RepID=A0A8S5MC11_9CAUD|nr:MAG TPA: hypothetical protein [Siphoviridae sp. ctG7D9]
MTVNYYILGYIIYSSYYCQKKGGKKNDLYN